MKQGNEYLQFFSSTNSGCKRTIGIARTGNLAGTWTVDPAPIVPVEEQIENSSLYFEPANSTWFLFTNHIGIKRDCPLVATSRTRQTNPDYRGPWTYGYNCWLACR